LGRGGILKITDINFCVDYDTVLVTALPASAVIAGVGTTITIQC